jgi:hypothetical protein
VRLLAKESFVCLILSEILSHLMGIFVKSWDSDHPHKRYITLVFVSVVYEK